MPGLLHHAQLPLDYQVFPKHFKSKPYSALVTCFNLEMSLSVTVVQLVTFNAIYSYKSHLSRAHSHQLDKALGLGRALDVWDQASCRPNTSAPESCHCPVGQVELLPKGRVGGEKAWV